MMKAKNIVMGLLTVVLLLSACVPVETPPEDNSQSSSYPLQIEFEDPSENSNETIRTDQETLPQVSQIGELAKEVYEINLGRPGLKEGEFNTTIGSSEEILKRREAWREELMVEDSPRINGQELHAIEQFDNNKATVFVQLDGKEVLSIDCGDISPINNLRGKWVSGDDWYVEIVYVDAWSEEQFSKGDIYKNGNSLNEVEGYDESFDFQILNGKPFYFFSKDGKLGFIYDGVEMDLDYDNIPHHLCCSASTNNPRHYSKMVTFFGSKNDTSYYIELGVFN